MTDITIGTTTAVSTYAPSLSNENGQITTTSTQVAQHFGKTHKSVLRAIKNLECSAEYRERNFAPTVETRANPSGGAPIESPAYRLTRDGFVFLAMGFTGKEAAQWKEAYITAFNKMEAELVKLQQPRIAYSVQPTDTLSAAQAEQLRLIFKEKCDTLPQTEQAGFMTKGWSKLKSHFGVAYRKIEQREFSEALSLATRHTADWTTIAQLTQPTEREPQMNLDVKTLTGMIHGGMIDPRALMDIAYAVNQQQFKTASANKNRGYGQEVADKIHGLSSADLHIITTAATMEMWLRTPAPQKEVALA